MRSDLQSLFGAPFGAGLTAGVEPATVGVKSRCSTRLSYNHIFVTGFEPVNA